jgi:hypothetical protein
MRSCISVCHVSAGDSWAGIENPVATLLRALSTYPQLDLSAIVLQDGHSLANCAASESRYG